MCAYCCFVYRDRIGLVLTSPGIGPVETRRVVANHRCIKAHHLIDAVGALDLDLTRDETAELETVYTTQPPSDCLPFAQVLESLPAWSDESGSSPQKFSERRL